MNVTKTKLPGVLIIEPRVFSDERGYFKETFQVDRYAEAGIHFPFVQDNVSRSKQGVLRGLHYQRNHPQGKLVSCTLGAVYDVAVDVNPTSATFGQYVGLELSAENHKQLWIPPGYAHGFLVLSEFAESHYKCTEYYHPQDEAGLIWNDSDVAIDWPLSVPILSYKDSKLPTLREIVAGYSR